MAEIPLTLIIVTMVVIPLVIVLGVRRAHRRRKPAPLPDRHTQTPNRNVDLPEIYFEAQGVSHDAIWVVLIYSFCMLICAGIPCFIFLMVTDQGPATENPWHTWPMIITVLGIGAALSYTTFLKLIREHQALVKDWEQGKGKALIFTKEHIAICTFLLGGYPTPRSFKAVNGFIKIPWTSIKKITISSPRVGTGSRNRRRRPSIYLLTLQNDESVYIFRRGAVTNFFAGHEEEIQACFQKYYSGLIESDNYFNTI